MAAASFHDYQARLAAAQQAFEQFFQGQLTCFEPEIKEVIAAVLAHPGKRLRPLFVFAAAQMLKDPSPQALRLAAIVEFIHLATLVHDDILDGATTRHGTTAHHLLFDPRISVLTGDTLFLRANELAAMEEDVWVGRIVSRVAKDTCSGEIAQGLRARKDTPLSMPEYEKQILGKTGRLFGLCCALGGYLAGMPEADRLRLMRFGELFGMSYQMYDDCVDIWSQESDAKKTLHTDQAQHKWTLPWILLYQSAPQLDFAPLWTSPSAALKAFEQYQILDKCRQHFDDLRAQATAALQGLPPGELLSMPLDFVAQAWAKLQPMKRAVNL